MTVRTEQSYGQRFARGASFFMGYPGPRSYLIHSLRGRRSLTFIWTTTFIWDSPTTSTTFLLLFIEYNKSISIFESRAHLSGYIIFSETRENQTIPYWFPAPPLFPHRSEFSVYRAKQGDESEALEFDQLRCLILWQSALQNYWVMGFKWQWFP